MVVCSLGYTANLVRAHQSTQKTLFYYRHTAQHRKFIKTIEKKFASHYQYLPIVYGKALVIVVLWWAATESLLWGSSPPTTAASATGLIVSTPTIAALFAENRQDSSSLSVQEIQLTTLIRPRFWPPKRHEAVKILALLVNVYPTNGLIS